MNKRGLSLVITTLILIVLVLVAVAIIWVVVNNILKGGTEGIALGKFTLDAEIKNVNIDNSSNNVSLTVKRNPGKGELNGIKFIFYDGTESEIITEEITLEELEQRRFYFHLININVDNLIRVSIVPIFKTASGEETLGNIIDVYEVKGGEGEEQETSCNPYTCAGLDYECGTWANGTCPGTLDCNNPGCGLHTTCPSGTCVCDSGWGDCNNNNSCDCDLSLNSCVGVNCVVFTGDVYWVSATGTSSWANCLSATPLSGSSACSLTIANANAQAGDIINLRGGTYNTQISPFNNGASNINRISFRTYDWEEVLFTAYASISLTNKQYITVNGIKIKLSSCSSSSCYVLLDNSNNIIIEHGVFDEITSQSGWPIGIYLRNNAHHNTFRNNIIGNVGYESSGPQDAGGVIRFGWDSGDDGSGYNLFENNTLFNGGHHVVEIYTSYNIFRNNIVHNDNWYSCSQPTNLCGNRNFIIDGGGLNANWNIIENNRIAFAGIPADSEAGAGISLRSGNNIIRNNLMYNNSGPAMSIEEYSYWPHDVSNNHIYNNVFFYNGHSPILTWWAAKYGMLIADQASTFISDLRIKNNIFYANLNGAIAFSNGVLRENQEISNNMEETGNPLFVNENVGSPDSNLLPDLSLQAGSPAIDAGTFLTNITSSGGSGNLFDVIDAGYFTDGFGIVEGDIIQLEGQTQTVQITNVNYSTNTITVDQSLTWTQNQGIALTYEGSAPDIGAYEYVS